MLPPDYQEFIKGSSIAFTSTIYTGLRPGYSPDVQAIEVGYALSLVRLYCDTHKIAVTVTPTHFVYPGGCEPGLIIGLFNSPRFPKDFVCDVETEALGLANYLRIQLKQERVYVVSMGSGSTAALMLETPPQVNKDADL